LTPSHYIKHISIKAFYKKGKEGWEAVAVYGDGMQTVVRILLKREIAEKGFE
jgi:hypothetical protein